MTFFSPPDFVYYHICVKILSEGPIKNIMQYKEQTGKGDTIKLAACVAAVAKKIASAITNSGAAAVLEFDRSFVAIFSENNRPDSAVKDADKLLIVSISNEDKCLGFLGDKAALTLLGMENHFVSSTNILGMSYPLFINISAHPLHQEYMYFVDKLSAGKGDDFVASLDRKIDDEKANKPRLKSNILIVFNTI